MQKKHPHRRCRHLPPYRLTPRSQTTPEQLETILESPHVWVGVFLQLKGVWNDLDGPNGRGGILTRFETQVEVARVFGVDVEGVHASFGVGFAVGLEPLVYLRLGISVSIMYFLVE